MLFVLFGAFSFFFPRGNYLNMLLDGNENHRTRIYFFLYFQVLFFFSCFDHFNIPERGGEGGLLVGVRVSCL